MARQRQSRRLLPLLLLLAAAALQLLLISSAAVAFTLPAVGGGSSSWRRHRLAAGQGAAAIRQRPSRPDPRLAATAAAAASGATAATAKPGRQQQSPPDNGGGGGGGGSAVRVQTMDYTTLLRVGGELRRRLLPGRVENAVQPDDYTLMLQIRSLSSLDWLLLSWHPEAARVSLLRPRGPQGQYKDGAGDGGGGRKKKRGGGGGGPSGGANSAFYSLPGQVRAHLQMRTLVGVRLPLPGERVLVLDFAERVTDAARPTHRIYVEVMGRRSNVLLVGCSGDGGQEEVLACGYQVSPSKSVRPVSVGQPYALPPPLTTPMPPLPPPATEAEIEAYAAEFTRRVALVPSYPLAKALMGAYRGLSPQLVQAMAGPAAAAMPVEALDPDAFLPAFFRGPFLAWLRVLAAEAEQERAWQEQAAAGLAPAVAPPPAPAATTTAAGDADGMPSGGLSWDGEGYTPLLFDDVVATSPASGGDGKGGAGGWRPLPSILDIVDRYYTSRLEARELLDLRRRGLAKVQAALGRLRRTRDEFARRLAAAGEGAVGELQATAELLTTYAYSWKDGDDACLCYDMETGAEIRIPLPPGKSAADEAQALYARVRKLRRSVDAVKPLLEKVEVKIAYVEELEASLLQLATATAADASDASDAGDKAAEGTDWGLLVSQDLAVMRELAEELGLDAPPSSSSSSSSAKGVGSSFFATILQRLSYPGVGEDGFDGAGGGGGGGGKGGGGKQGKGGKGGKQGQGKGGKTKQPAQQQKQQAKSAPAIQSYPLPSELLAEGGSPGPPIRALVGRNSRQNDHVTFALAQPHELWFHAQGVPGSHVLLRFDPGTEVGDAALQFAADLAAHFSKSRNAKEVPVMYTSPRNLKRIVGGGPGMVQVSKEKVVWGRPGDGEAIVRRATLAAEQQGEGRGV